MIDGTSINSEHTMPENGKGNAPKKKIVGNPDKTIPFRFKKGQSGNPAGSSVSQYLSTAMKRAMENGAYDVVAKKIIRAVKNTDKPLEIVALAQFIRDTVEGKPTQRVEVLHGMDASTLNRLAELAEKLNLLESGQCPSCGASMSGNGHQSQQVIDVTPSVPMLSETSDMES